MKKLFMTSPSRDGSERKILSKQNGSLLHLENLSKSFIEGNQRRVIFHDINLEIMRGQIVAILGKSGSGKSTLLNLISGIDRADSGSIRINGRDLTQLDEHQVTMFRRQEIGFIFQFFNLIPTLTVWENLTLPLELNGLGGPKESQWAQSLLETVGLLERKSTFPDRLSGGEQQRIAIARALVHDPLLVLADEPTGNLDEETGKKVLSLLESLTRQIGKSMILVTHSGDAASIADQVFHLREGRLVERSRGI